MDISSFIATPGKPFKLNDFRTDDDGGFEKKEAKHQLKKDIERISDLQYKLYAENRRALLILFQAMDSGGKDSAIKHIMTGINPQSPVSNIPAPRNWNTTTFGVITSIFLTGVASAFSTDPFMKMS